MNNRLLKKVFGISCLVVFVVVSGWIFDQYISKKIQNDRVDAANTSLNADVNAGTLSLFASSSVSMSAINLNGIGDAGANATGTISNIKVSDHRSSSPGWSATMTSTNFSTLQIAEPIPIVAKPENIWLDMFSIIKPVYAAVGKTIGVTNLTITPGAVSAIGNSSMTGVTAGREHTFTGTSDPATLMTATTGNGRGRYQQSANLSLFIDVSTVPGDYTATITETVS
ncbi:hypothetical protein KJ855_03350 [Patescibacteria group bacterium]|nr:hypothetical protein [Patescibacteria group bacterium]